MVGGGGAVVGAADVGAAVVGGGGAVVGAAVDGGAVPKTNSMKNKI